MFTTTKAVRFLGFTGVVGAVALLQACAPAGDEVDVKVNQQLNPLCTSLTKDGSCLSGGGIDTGDTGGLTGFDGDGRTVTRDGDQPKWTPPMPPAGYVAKWSRCTSYVEGEANVRDNSRIVEIAADGTVPIHRVEPVVGGKNNARRVKASSLHKLIGGSGIDKATGKVVAFVKIGQVVQTKNASGVVSQWVVSTESLGVPVQSKVDGKLVFRDRCYRKAGAGKDTMGHVTAGEELAATCIVEDINQEYNAMSAVTSGYWPVYNWADGKVVMRNDPTYAPHPDVYSTYLGTDPSGGYAYTGMGAAINDINGTERDEYTNYYPGEWACHMIVDGGYEVPGAKRPATRSLPAPGVVNAKTYLTWRPVNPNVTIANYTDPATPDPVEPEPPVAEEVLVEESDTVPM